MLEILFNYTMSIDENNKKQSISFSVPVVLRKPTNHTNEWDSCLTIPIKAGLSMKERGTVQYSNLQSAI